MVASIYTYYLTVPVIRQLRLMLGGILLLVIVGWLQAELDRRQDQTLRQIEDLAQRLDLPIARRVVGGLEDVLEKMERNVNSRLLAEVLLLDLPHL